MGYSRRTSNYPERIIVSNPSHMMSMADPISIGVETLTKRFRVVKAQKRRSNKIYKNRTRRDKIKSSNV